MAAGITLGIGTLTATVGTITLIRLLRNISASVGVAAPNEAMLKQENAAKKCALFRHFPSLTKTLAWRSLGAVDETPIHICTLPLKEDESKSLQFYIKREDLISEQYGGNKVRTLQHQLAVCEARRDT